MEPLTLPFGELVNGLSRYTEVIWIGAGLLLFGLITGLVLRRCSCQPCGAATNLDVPPDGTGSPKTDTQNLAVGLVPQVQPVRPVNQGAGIRFFLRSLGVAGVLLICGLVGIEYLGAAPLLRWSFSNLQRKTGVSLTFSDATGGPLRGEFVLHQVRAVRENDVHSNFDILSSRVTVRFSIWKMLGQPLEFDELRAEEISGRYEKITHRGGLGSGSEMSKMKRMERNIPIGRLTIQDASIKYADHSVGGDPVDFDLVVKSLECKPFRTAFAPHDILFRAYVEGTLDGHPFSINTEPNDGGMKTEWKVTNLPMHVARAYLTGPFRLLRAGEFDVHVVQDTPDDRQIPALLNAKLNFRAVRAGLPDDVKPAVAIAAQVLMTQLKKVPNKMELEFRVELNQDKYDLTTTEDLHDVWVQFRAGAVSSLLKTSGVKVEMVSDSVGQELNLTVDDITQKAFQILDKARERRKEKKEIKAKERELKKEEAEAK